MTSFIARNQKCLGAALHRNWNIIGSYARGEERDGSDLDVLVNFKDNATLYDLVGLADFLEDALHRKVDVVSRRALREEIKDRILEDLIPV